MASADQSSTSPAGIDSSLFRTNSKTFALLASAAELKSVQCSPVVLRWGLLDQRCLSSELVQWGFSSEMELVHSGLELSALASQLKFQPFPLLERHLVELQLHLSSTQTVSLGFLATLSLNLLSHPSFDRHFGDPP